MNAEKLNSTVKRVTELLAREAYEELEKLSKGVHLAANELKQAVDGYGRTILPLPKHAYGEINVIKIERVDPKQWSVNVPVYTKEEGKSDLTLELTLVDSSSELFGVEVHNLHVL